MRKPHLYHDAAGWHVRHYNYTSMAYDFREACMVARWCMR